MCAAYDFKGGRSCIAPEKLLRTMLLQIFRNIRSERLLMEQTQYNPLFCWLIDLSMDDTVWVPSVFTKYREQLIENDAVFNLFNGVLAIATKNDWLSGEHFSMAGIVNLAWSGHKSFIRKDGCNEDTGHFKGPSRNNGTHASSTEADARRYRKGNAASEQCGMDHTLSDNRHELITSTLVNTADGCVEREAAKVMVTYTKQAADEKALISLCADKGYDAAEFIAALTDMQVQPHVAQNTSNRTPAVPDSVAKSEGYAISQQKRKLIEQGFGWTKFVGPMRQVMVRGLKKVDQLFVLTMAAYNLNYFTDGHMIVRDATQRALRWVVFQPPAKVEAFTIIN